MLGNNRFPRVRIGSWSEESRSLSTQLCLRVKSATLALALSMLAATAANASTWDLARDFSATANPNGAWTLGYSGAGGTTFMPFMKSYPLSAANRYYGDKGSIVYWSTPQWPTGSLEASSIGMVYGQPSADVTLFELPPTTRAGIPIVRQKSGGVVVHPGSAFQSVARWKAPVTGAFYIHAIATNADSIVGASITITVLKNGIAQYTSTMSGLTGLKVYRTAETGISLNAGDVIDVAIGSNGSNLYDSTGLDVMIKAVNVAQ